MIRFTPSARWDADGNAVPGCDSHCYCEVPADCRLATIPAIVGAGQDIRDVGTHEVIVRTGPTVNTVTLYADVDAVPGFNQGISLAVSIGFGSITFTLKADALTAVGSIPGGSSAGDTIGQATICVTEDGTVTGIVSSDKGASESVFIENYTTSNRNHAGINGTDTSETTVDQIQTTAFPECPPCPIPPGVGCDICESVPGGQTPDAFNVILDGFADTGPDCEDGQTCSEMNGSYVVPRTVQKCQYFLRVPFSQVCNFIGSGRDYNIEGFCISIVIQEEGGPPADRYRVNLAITWYGEEGASGTSTLSCITDDGQPNNRYAWFDPVSNDPNVTPCQNYSRALQSATQVLEGLSYLDETLTPRQCGDVGAANLLATIAAA